MCRSRSNCPRPMPPRLATTRKASVAMDYDAIHKAMTPVVAWTIPKARDQQATFRSRDILLLRTAGATAASVARVPVGTLWTTGIGTGVNDGGTMWTRYSHGS